MLLQLSHSTEYRYTPAVLGAQHIAYLQPRNHAGQTLLEHQLLVNPSPAQMQTSLDVYGNTRCYLSLQTPHQILNVVAQSLVATQASATVSSSIAWDDERTQSAIIGIPAVFEFALDSQFVPRHSAFLDYARTSFPNRRPLLEALVELNQRIHTELRYESHSTHINTPALDALRQGKGVCQDFAHIMLACLRTLGLSARYVSGYVRTHNPQVGTPMLGSDASHAWVSVFVPDIAGQERWVDFDPTNNRWGHYAPGEDYITLAWGRDFADVSPLRGVIHGGANHQLSVGVTLTRLDG